MWSERSRIQKYSAPIGQTISTTIMATINNQGPADHQCSIFWQEYVGFDFEFVKIKLILALMWAGLQI